MQNVLPLHNYQSRTDTAKISKADFLFQMEYLIKKVNALESQLQEMNESQDKSVSFSLQEGIVFLKTEDIIRCEAESNYTIIHTRHQSKIVISQTLKAVESKIDDPSFIRVHSGHLANKAYIKQLTKKDSTRAILSNGDEVPVSRAKWKAVVEKMTD